MLTCFSDPYPDELFYSICARFGDRTRYSSRNATLEDLFGKRQISVAVAFPSNLGNLVAALPVETHYTFKYLIEKHTLLPFYAPFIPFEQLQKLVERMRHKSAPRPLQSANIPSVQWLRFCQKCVEEDKASLGECYWHRIHQIPGVEICSHHKMPLQNSSAPTQNGKRGMLYSAESTILSVPSQKPELSKFDHEIFLQIALDALWLLDQPCMVSRLEALQDQYERVLAMQGMATHRGRVRADQLLSMFENRYPISLIKELYCDYGVSHERNWLSHFFARPYVTRNPIQHLLWMHFMDYTAEAFFKLSTEHKPFGDGPWPCLNPVCKYYHEPCIQEYSLTRSHKGHNNYGAPIGTFSCNCGFIYCRRGPDLSKEDRFRISKVKSYGHEWEQMLRSLWSDGDVSIRHIAHQLGANSETIRYHAAQLGLPFSPLRRTQWIRTYGIEWEQTLSLLWKDETISLNEIARRLHVGAPTVVTYAARLGLPFSGTQGRSFYSETVMQRTQESKRVAQEKHRAIWLSAVEQNPEASLKTLRNKLYQTHRWLYLYDTVWLREHQPMRHHSKKRQMHIFKTGQMNSDFQLAELTRNAALYIRNLPGRPKWVTAAAIFTHLGIPKSLHTSIKRLPLTASALDEVVETPEMWAVRKIQWTVDRYRQENHYPSRHTFVRRAGVAKWKSVQIKEAIDNALRSLRN